MPYILPNLPDSELVDQDFDRLDWLLRDGKLSLVRDACDFILASTPSPQKKSLAHLLLATTELLNGCYQEALVHLENTLSIPSPLYSRTTAAKAKALTMVGRPNDAWQLLTHLQASHPNCSPTWEALAIWHKTQGDENSAWHALLRASALAPSNSSIISTLISIGLRPDRSLELTIALQRHLALEPMNLGFRACLVTCFLSIGEIDQARTQAQRIISFAPFSIISPDVVTSMQELLNQLNHSQDR